MKELNKLIKAHKKAGEADFNFKKKCGFTIFGDGTTLYTNTKEDLYKLAELLKTDVTVYGKQGILSFYTIEYNNSTKIVFVEQSRMTEEQEKACVEALEAKIKDVKEWAIKWQNKITQK